MTEHRLIDLDRLAAEYDGNGHSIFAPSSSKMWLTCSGSLVANLLVPDSAGYEAAEGTVAHMVAEQWLRSNVKPTHLVGTNVVVDERDDWYLVWIDEDMLDHIQHYVDFCRMLPGRHFIERRVNLSRITPIPGQGGTADFIAIEKGVLHVVDLKYGKGVRVDVEGNTQALLYALGAYCEFNLDNWFHTIHITIVQPRMGNTGETWTITSEQLLEFQAYARERAYAAWKVDAPRTPSEDACQWCRVKATCAAAAKVVNDITAGAFTAIESEQTSDHVSAWRDELQVFGTPPIPSGMMELTIDEMASLYALRGFAESWWKSLGDALFRAAAEGRQVPGYKLVGGRSKRIFRERAQSALIHAGLPEGDVIKQSLISPAEAEKRLKKLGLRGKALEEFLSDLVFKPVGRPTLAPLSDKRPALVDLSAIAFAEQPEEDEDEEI